MLLTANKIFTLNLANDSYFRIGESLTIFSERSGLFFNKKLLKNRSMKS